MDNKWIINTKGGPGKDSWEISVVRADNEHGIESYGWFDNKVKYMIGSSGGPCRDAVIEDVWEALIEVAKHIRDKFNLVETFCGAIQDGIKACEDWKKL